METDQALVAAAQAGDEHAAEAIVHRYQNRIYNFALAMTGSSADADDLAQETFIRALRGLPRFRGDSSLKNWLYRIATNAARSHRGARMRRAPVWETRLESDTLAERQFASGEESAEQRAIRRQTVDRALAALPADLRKAVVLRDIEGLEYREIASVLNIPIGTVMSRIFRGRQRLRPLLADIGGAPAGAAAEADVAVPLASRRNLVRNAG